MTDGFIFNQNMCVACGACSAACVVENGLNFNPRTIYTFNDSALPSLPVINLSLACNHCEKAVCMEGCPSSSYFRDAATGAIVIDDTKCIGCRYCQWNCPYGAPKFIVPEKVIGKCHLCYQRLADGFSPACSTACPTGALGFGKLNDGHSSEKIPWFPDKQLKPSIKFTGTSDSSPKIIPDNAFDKEPLATTSDKEPVQEEWSLIAFSFLTILSVSELLASLIAGIYQESFQFLIIITLAALFSILHLGKKNRAWRAVLNMRHSPLSREIGLFIIYSILGGVTVIIRLPVLLVLSSITGLILVMAVDSVYLFTDRRKSVLLHSGQAFLTVLLIASFLSGIILPFIFIAAVKLLVSFRLMWKKRDDSFIFVIRFFRSSFLILSGVSLISGISYADTSIICLFLAGELLDRILFYFDFKPLNIERLRNSYKIEP